MNIYKVKYLDSTRQEAEIEMMASSYEDLLEKFRDKKIGKMLDADLEKTIKFTYEGDKNVSFKIVRKPNRKGED